MPGPDVVYSSWFGNGCFDQLPLSDGFPLEGERMASARVKSSADLFEVHEQAGIEQAPCRSKKMVSLCTSRLGDNKLNLCCRSIIAWQAGTVGIGGINARHFNTKHAPSNSSITCLCKKGIVPVDWLNTLFGMSTPCYCSNH
jgi:hypothetical protein